MNHAFVRQRLRQRLCDLGAPGICSRRVLLLLADGKVFIDETNDTEVDHDVVRMGR